MYMRDTSNFSEVSCFCSVSTHESDLESLEASSISEVHFKNESGWQMD